jgi:hypothetical protein
MLFKSGNRAFFGLIFAIVAVSSATAANSYDSVTSNQPRIAPDNQNNGVLPAAVLEPKNLPDFPSQNSPSASLDSSNSAARTTRPASAGTALQGEAASTTIPLETRLKLVLETAVDAKSSSPGEIFEAHVKDDLFFGSNLLLAKGSLIRGRVVEVSKPRLISRAARIGLKLEQIVTPAGEIIPLDAALEFRKGTTNQKGQLDPGTSLSTRVESERRTVSGLSSTGATKGALVAANIATLGAPTIATAIGGSAIALFRSGDNVSLAPGQELEVLLTNDLGLQVN